MECLVASTEIPVVTVAAKDAASRRLIIQTIRRDRSGSIWTDEASDVSRPDRSGADQIDADHQATEGGGWGFESLAARSSPSQGRRPPMSGQQTGC
jgi:hypothetical protein